MLSGAGVGTGAGVSCGFGASGTTGGVTSGVGGTTAGVGVGTGTCGTAGRTHEVTDRLYAYGSDAFVSIFCWSLPEIVGFIG